MAPHPGEVKMSECTSQTELVLQNPGQFPPERVEYHRKLAGTVFASGHSPFVLYGDEYLESPPVTNPLTTQLGAQMMCDACPSKQLCDPDVTVQPDKRILVQGWFVGAPECEIAHPMPHAQTPSSTS